MSDLRNVVGGIAERLVTDDLATTHHGAEHLARYLFAAHFAPGQNVVDLGCGVGYGTNVLLASGARRALGVDISETAIEHATGRYRGCEFTVDDVTQPLDLTAFGVRVCYEAIEHVTDPQALVRTLAADLPPGGLSLVSTPNGASPALPNPHHLHEFDGDQFRALLEE